MSCLAVIPARGGSKGLPGKNIRSLAGLPLIAHSLECARLASGLTRVIVSTDSEEIAAVARKHGAEVPFLRPAELARDDTPMMPVLRHALLEMERIDGREYDTLLLLDPTSPGRLPTEIDRAMITLAGDPAAAGVMSCSMPTFNPFWVGVVEEDGVLAPAFDGAGKYKRRQDVPPFYRINGSLYLWRRDHVLNGGDDWSKARHLLLEMPEDRALSIDDLYEFQLAEALIEKGLVKLPWLRK